MNKYLYNKYNAFLLLCLITLAQAVFTFSFIITNLYEIKTSGVDGRSFEQVIFNFLNGNGLTSTIAPPYIKQSWLGVHFSPILYVISPIYLLFPHIEIFPFLQSFLLAAAAIPIFFTARIIIKSDWYALIIAILYLINPFVINAQIWDFHEIAFAPLIISFILWSIVAKRPLYFVMFCSILLLIKEHYGLAVFGSGLLWAWRWREYRFGIIVSIFGLLSFFLVIMVIMPNINPTGAAAMMSAHSSIDHFSWIFSPLQNIDLLLFRLYESALYILLIISLLLFQPIFSFMWLLPALADFVVNSLSNNSMLRDPFSYHSAAIIPVLLIAYADSITKRYKDDTTSSKSHMLIATSVIVIVFSYALSSLPYFPNNLWEFSSPRFARAQKDQESIDKVNEIIGKDSSVTAQCNLLPHITIRKLLYLFPNNISESEYILINTSIPFDRKSNVFGNPYSGTDTDRFFGTLLKILDEGKFGIIFYQNNWLLFKRGAQVDNTITNKVKTDIENLIIKIETLDKRKINTNYYATTR